MALIKPFRGFLYSPTKVELSTVVAPPYDVISPRQQDALYAASPYNVVRLDFGREDDRYTSGRRYFDEWKKNEILVQDNLPAFYGLFQDFVTAENERLRRRGFIASLRLEEFGAGTIFPHEKTLAKPKEDRFRLLQATHAHFSQIFGLYADPQREIDSYLQRVETARPVIDVTFEGVRNRLWRLTESPTLTALQQLMRDKKILVADGHHRYETALRFRDAMRETIPRHTGDESYNFIPMYFTNLHGSGLVILPTHRLLHGLKNFTVSKFLNDLKQYFRLTVQTNEKEFLKNLRRQAQSAFGLVFPSDPHFVLCRLEDPSRVQSLMDANLPGIVKELDVTILHRLIFEHILGITPAAQEQKLNLDYVHDTHEAIEAVKGAKVQAAFLMNSPRIDQVRDVAEAGYTMPQKSTYFYPKLLSGLVIHQVEGD